MKKYIFGIFVGLFMFSCNNKKVDAVVESKISSSNHEVLPVHDIQAQSFMSEVFTATNLKDGKFDLKVSFNKETFQTKVKIILDDKNITDSIYKELKKRKKNDLQIWLNQKGEVCDVLMMDIAKPNSPVRGAQSIFIKGEYPIIGRSSD